jgi:hypothetical protein
MLAKRTTTIHLKKLPHMPPPRMAFGIRILALDIHRHVVELNWLMETHPPLDKDLRRNNLNENIE